MSRRPAFPSWSWAGWGGRGVHFPITRIGDFQRKNKSIHFEFGQDCLVEQSYFLRNSRLEELDIRSPRGLQLDVLLAPPTSINLSKDDPHSWEVAWQKATLSLSVCETTIHDDPWSTLAKFKEKEWLLVLVGHFGLFRDSATYFIVVRQHIAFTSKIGVVEVQGKYFPSESFSEGRTRLL